MGLSRHAVNAEAVVWKIKLNNRLTMTLVEVIFSVEGIVLHPMAEGIKKITISIPDEKPRLAKFKTPLGNGFDAELSLGWLDEFMSWLPHTIELIEYGNKNEAIEVA